MNKLYGKDCVAQYRDDMQELKRESDRLTVEGVLASPEKVKDIWIKILSKQLADTMRENQRLKAELEDECANQSNKESDNA